MGYYWQVADGRVWSADDAAFVKALPEWADLTPLHRNGQPAGLDYLRDTIRFYGCELGELAATLERITAVQEKYRPGLAALDAAYLSAQIDGDEETTAEIAAEKRELRAALAAEIKAIQEEK